MNKETLEHLSSLMDGELSNETGVFLARRMCSDSEMSDKWERYHLLRECLRRPGEQWVLSDLSMNVQDIPDEPAPAQPSRWIKPLSGLAVAASVAVAAVLVVLQTGPAVDTETPEPFASSNRLNAIPMSQPASLNGGSEAEQQTLNSYLLRHNQVTGTVGQQGFVAFVPIVTTSRVQLIESDEETETITEADTDIESATAADK